MYAWTTLRLFGDRLAALRAHAETLDLRPLPGSVSRFAAVAHEALDGLFAPEYVRAAFVVSLDPMQQIPSHVDASIAPAVRYHIAIRTNPLAWSFHAGQWRHLEEGYVYQMDPTEPHGAVNWGTEPRWHLLVDIVEGA
jgi:hypothetical protein